MTFSFINDSNFSPTNNNNNHQTELNSHGKTFVFRFVRVCMCVCLKYHWIYIADIYIGEIVSLILLILNFHISFTFLTRSSKWMWNHHLKSISHKGLGPVERCSSFYSLYSSLYFSSFFETDFSSFNFNKTERKIHHCRWIPLWWNRITRFSFQMHCIQKKKRKKECSPTE